MNNPTDLDLSNLQALQALKYLQQQPSLLFNPLLQATAPQQVSII